MKLERMPNSSLAFISQGEICFIFSELGSNKNCALDCIPSEIFKYAPALIYNWLANPVDMMIAHCYNPCTITDAKIVPVLKILIH